MIYVSSDWHGTSPQRIAELLALADFSENDFLYVLGDVIDRGSHGVALLKMLMGAKNIELILGNHEAMMLSCEWMFDEVNENTVADLNAKKLHAMNAWQMNGATPTMEGLRCEHYSVREDILDYLWDCPLYREIEVAGRRFLLVHAGLGNYHDGYKIEYASEHDLLWTRPSLDTKYSEEFTTVFGHTPTLYYGEEYSGHIINNGTWINVDTGAAGGLSPALLRLDDMKEFYLPD